MIYTKKVQTQIDVIQSQIDKHEAAIEKLKRKAEDLAVGQCPIKPGNIIVWTSGNTQRRGKVIGITTEWGGFQYRCHIITKKGKEIGFANVCDRHQPTLEVEP